MGYVALPRGDPAPLVLLLSATKTPRGSDSRNAVDWDPACASNRGHWEDRVPLHEKACRVSELDDPNHLTGIIRADWAAMASFLPHGTVSGLDVSAAMAFRH